MHWEGFTRKIALDQRQNLAVNETFRGVAGHPLFVGQQVIEVKKSRGLSINPTSLRSMQFLKGVLLRVRGSRPPKIPSAVTVLWVTGIRLAVLPALDPRTFRSAG